ncbi:MAG: hypothetical protein ACQGVK_11495 [Myxococcota bacterium]
MDRRRPSRLHIPAGLLLLAALAATGSAGADDRLRGPTPSTDAARRALESTTTHRQVESQRARRRLDRIDRRSEAAAARSEAARPRPRSPGERPSPDRSPPSLRVDRRLDLDREIGEVERWLARPDLGPVTRRTVERYRQELLGERNAPDPSP